MAALGLAAATVGLALLAAWPLTYFWVQGAAGQRGLRDSLLRDVRPGALSFHSIQWGPDPRELWLCDAMIRTRAGEPAIGAGVIGGTLSGAALWRGQLHFEQTRATDFEVRLGWDEAGAFSLKGAFKDPGPEPAEPKGVPPLVRFDGITLARGLVTLEWPGFGLRFEAVDAAGRVYLGGERGLVIDADLTGAATSARVGRGGARIAFDRIGIEDFAWDGPGFSVARLALAAQTGAEVSVGGRLGFAEGAGFFESRGRVRVGAAEVGAVLGEWTPEGFTLDDVVVDSRGGKSVVTVARAQVAELLAGPVRVRGLDLPVRAEASGVGSLGQRGSFETRGARAARVEGPEGVALDGVKIQELTAAGGTSGAVVLEGLEADALVLPAGRTSRLRAGGKIDAGLTGGTLSGEVSTDAGSVEAKGQIGVSLLTRDVTVELGLTLRALTAALATTLLDALPDAVAAELTPPLAGTARTKGRLARSKDAAGKSRWGLELTLESGEIVGDQRAEWRDGAWVIAAAPAAMLP
jgi:hypothetical protein